VSTTGRKYDVEADKIFKAGTIITAPGGTDADFLAVRRGRVVATGRRPEGVAFEHAGVPVIDLGDAAVLPGLWDAHVHLLLTGLALRQADLSGARSLADVFEVVREAAGGGDEIAICGGLDETRLAEGRLPTGAELDAASPQKPIVVVRVDSHSLVINEAARRHLTVESSWPGVELDADGRPTGVLRGRANEMARTKIYNRVDAATKAAAYADAAALAASRGVVALCALEGGRLFGEDDVPVLLACRDRLPLETFVFPQIPSATAARELGLPRLGGCILVDGSLGSWTAALTEPYADRPTTRGELYFAADDLNAIVLAAHATGLQVALHAIGDRAVTQVLDAYEIAAQEHPRADCRHRVEHAELATDRDLRRAAELGVIFSMTNRLRSALKAGVALAGGSDSNITPLNPLLGIAAAMAHPNEDERLSFDEALAMFTTGAAAAAFAENDWGTLEPGKSASFAVLPRDPRSLNPEEIAATEVVATVVRGEFTYRRGDEAAGGQEPRAAS